MPPPPPYYYRPVYGHGYGPSHYYRPPPSYNKILSDNKVIVVNNDHRNNRYWGGFDDKPSGRPRKTAIQSPITAAKPNRPELKQLNAEAKERQAKQKREPTRARPATADAPGSDWKGRTTYAGASPETRQQAKLPAKPASPEASARAASNVAAARDKKPSAQGDRGYGAGRTTAATASSGAAAPSTQGGRGKARGATQAASGAKSAATRPPVQCRQGPFERDPLEAEGKFHQDEPGQAVEQSQWCNHEGSQPARAQQRALREQRHNRQATLK